MRAAAYHHGVPEQPEFVSYAPDHEDVVLWRALGDVVAGRYVDLAGGSDAGNLSRGLHERGWSGVVLAEDELQADALREQRPGDHVVSSLIDVSTEPVHLLVLGRAGAGDLTDVVSRMTPWVVVLPADATEAVVALAAEGYTPALDTGLSRLLLSPQHDELAPALRYPATSRDGFVDATTAALQGTVDELTRELQRWRGLALSSWTTWQPRHTSEWTIHDERERDSLRTELERIQQTLSWRITRPLRALRRLSSR